MNLDVRAADSNFNQAEIWDSNSGWHQSKQGFIPLDQKLDCPSKTFVICYETNCFSLYAVPVKMINLSLAYTYFVN